MTDRQFILDTVKEMPEKASMAEILDKLKLLQSVRQGMADAKAGRVTPHEDVAKLVRGWIKVLSSKSAS